MLRLAVARSTRRYASKATRYVRKNSRALGSASLPPTELKASTSIKELIGDDAIDIPFARSLNEAEEANRLFEALTGDLQDKEQLETLQKLVAETFSQEPASQTLPMVAQTEEQLFGGKVRMRQQNRENFKSLGLKIDPALLPIERTLDPYNKPYSEEEYAMTLVHGRGVHVPFFHPRTHDIPVANIHFRSHHVPLLNLFTHFATHAASSLGIPTSKVVYLPTQRTLWTVLRSPFAHKKSQENFDRKVHKRAIKAWDADPEVVQRWIMYLRKNAMPGVGMKVTTWERLPLGIGSSELVDDGKAKGKRGAVTRVANTVKELGEKIVVEETAAASATPPP